MLVMTSALKPPPLRIAKIGENVVLPRSIPALQAAAALGGALVGLLLAALFVAPFFGLTFVSVALFMVAFGSGGVVLVSWSPMRGESFAKWIGLNVNGLRLNKVEIDGLAARAYIGIAPLHCSALGELRVARGAVDVVAGSVDERGVLIPHDERRRMLLGHHPGRAPGYEDGFQQPRRLGDRAGLSFPTAPTLPSPQATANEQLYGVAPEPGGFPAVTTPEMYSSDVGDFAPQRALPVMDTRSRRKRKRG